MTVLERLLSNDTQKSLSSMIVRHSVPCKINKHLWCKRDRRRWHWKSKEVIVFDEFPTMHWPDPIFYYIFLPAAVFFNIFCFLGSPYEPSVPINDDPRNQVTSAMDWTTCAALHNQIMRIGWEGSGRSFDDLNRTTMWQRYGTEFEAIQDRLTPSVTEFLKHAWNTPYPVEPRGFSFFYFVGSLAAPDYMFFNREIENVDAGWDRYVTLYAANYIGEHSDGVVFDMQRHVAILKVDIMDDDDKNEALWMPLEVLLKKWLEMIEEGKIVPILETEHGDGIPDNAPESLIDNERFEWSEGVGGGNKFNPWVVLPYTKKNLSRALAVWNMLVAAIETRMPVPGVIGITGLVDQETLDITGLRPGFARDFLLNARKPDFLHIAPGLRVPGPGQFRSQPFLTRIVDSGEDEDNFLSDVRPVLLFAGMDAITDHEFGFSWPGWPYYKVHSYPTGLYLSGSRQGVMPFEDGVRLVLPFALGESSYARTSDNTTIEAVQQGYSLNYESYHEEPVIAELYQSGMQPASDRHDQSLVKVLEIWKYMVEMGYWTVDEHGVSGPITIFRDADTPEHWKKYWIEPSW